MLERARDTVPRRVQARAQEKSSQGEIQTKAQTADLSVFVKTKPPKKNRGLFRLVFVVTVIYNKTGLHFWQTSALAGAEL